MITPNHHMFPFLFILKIYFLCDYAWIPHTYFSWLVTTCAHLSCCCMWHLSANLPHHNHHFSSKSNCCSMCMGGYIFFFSVGGGWIIINLFLTIIMFTISIIFSVKISSCTSCNLFFVFSFLVCCLVVGGGGLMVPKILWLVGFVSRWLIPLWSTT